MGKQKYVRGEKKKLRDLEEKLGRKLTREEKIKVHKKAKGEARRKAIRNTVLGALGLATVIGGGVKLLGEGEETGKAIQPIKIEQENKFKESLKVAQKDLKEIVSQSEARDKIEKEVNALKNEEDVIAYLKDLYIEKYEQETGDTKLTTEDIKITSNYENYVYVNEKTGEMSTHGEFPLETVKTLQEKNISYTTQDEVEVYKVQNNEGKIIDCITMKSKDGKSVPEEVLIEGESQENKSIMKQMGNTIDDAFDYMKDMDNQEEKDNFIKSVKSLKEEKNKTIEDKIVEDEGMGIE